MTTKEQELKLILDILLRIEEVQAKIEEMETLTSKAIELANKLLILYYYPEKPQTTTNDNKGTQEH